VKAAEHLRARAPLMPTIRNWHSPFSCCLSRQPHEEADAALSWLNEPRSGLEVLFTLVPSWLRANTYERAALSFCQSQRLTPHSFELLYDSRSCALQFGSQP